jgi:hypothetical protein
MRDTIIKERVTPIEQIWAREIELFKSENPTEEVPMYRKYKTQLARQRFKAHGSKKANSLKVHILFQMVQLYFFRFKFGVIVTQRVIVPIIELRATMVE